MSVNSRFAVAIHILTMLAYQQPELLTSGFIACSVTTNPVVIRRVLGDLRRAGLVTSQAGSGGGWKLRREPEQITLLDAYEAVKEGTLLPCMRSAQPALRHRQNYPEHAGRLFYRSRNRSGSATGAKHHRRRSGTHEGTKLSCRPITGKANA